MIGSNGVKVILKKSRMLCVKKETLMCPHPSALDERVLLGPPPSMAHPRNKSKHWPTTLLDSNHRTVLRLSPPVCSYHKQTVESSFFKRDLLFHQTKAKSFGADRRNLTRGISADDIIPVTISQIRKYLKEKEISFSAGYTSLILTSPFCCCSDETGEGGGGGEDSSYSSSVTVKLKSTMYINMVTGDYICTICNLHGNWKHFQDCYELHLQHIQLVADCQAVSDNRPVFELKSYNENVLDRELVNIDLRKLKQLISESVSVASVASADDNLSHASCIQVLSSYILEKFNVVFHPESRCLILPRYSQDSTLTGAKLINIDTMQEQHIPRSSNDGLFGWGTITKNTRKVVLTSNEFDAMALGLMTKLAVVCLPRGTSSLALELLPQLEQFSSVTLWFPGDVRSWESAKQFAHKLNLKRCFYVRPSEATPQAFSAVVKGLDVNTIIKQAQPMSHKSIITFRKLRDDVLNEIIHAEQVAGVQWQRFLKMNKYLKGHRRGELTVFTGPTGSGKTTFLCEYSLDLYMQGVRTLWGSFEIRNVRLAKTMLKQYALRSFEDGIEGFDYWADMFEMLPVYFMDFHGEQSIKNVSEAMAHAVYVHDIEHVIVDNMQFMMGTKPSNLDRFLLQDSVIAEFRKFATVHNCHVTLVIHPRKEKETEELHISSIFGSAKASQEADNIFILQDERFIGKQKKYIQLVKNRYDGDLGRISLKFDKESQTMSGIMKQNSQSSENDPDHSENDPESEATNNLSAWLEDRVNGGYSSDYDDVDD